MERGRPSQEVLKEDPHRPVVRVEGTVRRQPSWWTPAVHGLLDYLEASDFPYSPRVLGFDDEGREMLSLIEGDSGAGSWPKVAHDHGLRRFAHLLRRYHERVRGFQPDPSAEWAYGAERVKPDELICHGDFGPWNVVWQREEPVGVLDWDFAYPGPAIDDVAYALEYVVPFRDDETCVKWLAYEAPPDRKHRIKVFAEAYGLPSAEGLVDEVIRRQRLTAEQGRILAERGLPRAADWVSPEAQLERALWSEQNRQLFE